MKRIHFIAIGGAAMHNLALALQKNGFQVSGSDDEIAEPSLSRLKAAGLLPDQTGWFPEKISKELDAVILGMHARADNPELLRAQSLGLPVFSYPEFLYEDAKDKLRVVIGGSHGKTTITAMVLHVLKMTGRNADYMVGAKLDGYETMVQLSDAPIMVLEGDEYLSSPIDRRPKFHLYRADIGLISGIAWDHVNVFPTFENYVDQFRIFAEAIPATGSLIYCLEDPELIKLIASSTCNARLIPYGIPDHRIENGKTILNTAYGEFPLQVFGKHNLMNLEAARLVCTSLNIAEKDFYAAITSFSGAARRLEKLGESDHTIIFRDFAHSPSKLAATTTAVAEQFSDRTVVACMELHTFSSLNSEFLSQYKNTMNAADLAIVYYNPQTLIHKKLAPLNNSDVKSAFGREDLLVFDDAKLLNKYLQNLEAQERVVLMMSSGTFNGIDLQELTNRLTGKKASVA